MPSHDMRYVQEYVVGVFIHSVPVSVPVPDLWSLVCALWLRISNQVRISYFVSHIPLLGSGVSDVGPPWHRTRHDARSPACERTRRKATLTEIGGQSARALALMYILTRGGYVTCGRVNTPIWTMAESLSWSWVTGSARSPTVPAARLVTPDCSS